MFLSILRALVNIIFGFAEIILGIRIILKLFGANPQAVFVDWVYETSAPLLQPFAGAFPAPALEGGFIIEFSTLFALIIYALAGYLILELLAFIERKVSNNHTV